MKNRKVRLIRRDQEWKPNAFIIKNRPSNRTVFCFLYEVNVSPENLTDMLILWYYYDALVERKLIIFLIDKEDDNDGKYIDYVDYRRPEKII